MMMKNEKIVFSFLFFNFVNLKKKQKNANKRFHNSTMIFRQYLPFAH